MLATSGTSSVALSDRHSRSVYPGVPHVQEKLLAGFGLFTEPWLQSVRTPTAPGAARRAAGRSPSNGATQGDPSPVTTPVRFGRQAQADVRGDSASSSSRSSSSRSPTGGLDVSRTGRPERPPRPPKPTRRKRAVGATPDSQGTALSRLQWSTAARSPRQDTLSSSSSDEGGLQAACNHSVHPIGGGEAARVTTPKSATTFLGTPPLPIPLTTSTQHSNRTTGGGGNVFGAACLPRTSSARGQGVVEAFCVVVQDMVQVKYGLALDTSDFFRKVHAHCKDLGKSEDALLAPADLVARFNAWPDLRFRLCNSRQLLSLRIDVRSSGSFEELHRDVLCMPGTAQALALVDPWAPTSCSGGSSSRVEALLSAVAVFRQDYARSQTLVGRATVPGVPPLVTFGFAGFVSAVVLDPHVLAIFQHDGRRLLDAAGQPPPLRDEYGQLQSSAQLQRQQKQEQQQQKQEPQERNISVTAMCPASDESSSPPAWSETATGPGASPFSQAPWREAPSEVLSREVTEVSVGGAEGNGPAPAQRWMRRLRRSLENSDASGEPQLALLQQLNLWLDGSTDMAAAARRALADAGLHTSLVDVVRRAGAAGGRGPAEVAIAAQACRSIGLGCRNYPDSAAAFGRSLAVPAICSLMRRWLANASVQVNAALALRTLFEESATALSDGVSVGAPQLLRASLASHPKLEELKHDATCASQMLAEYTQESATADGLEQSSNDPVTNPRSGLAAALLERRAADQARVSVVSQAVGWLFSGGRSAASAGRGPRQGTSEPPGCRIPSAPAPCMPVPPAVPRLDLRTVLQGSDGRQTGRCSSVLAALTLGGRRAASVSRLRPLETMETSRISARDASPHTPPAARLQRRDEAPIASTGTTAADGGTHEW